MAYKFDVFSAITLLQNFLMTSLAAQGEATPSVPYTFAIDQYPFEAVAKPLTMIDVGNTEITHDICPNRVMFCLHADVHHIRDRASDTEEATCLTRLATVAVGMETDYRFASVAGATLMIEQVMVNGFQIEGSPRLQMALQQNLQNVGLAVVSMPLTINWTEGLLQ